MNLCVDCGKKVTKQSIRCYKCAGNFKATRPVRFFFCEVCGKEVRSRRPEARFCSISCANKILAKEKAKRLTPENRLIRGEGLRQWHAQMKAEGRNANQERWNNAKQKGSIWVEKHKQVLTELHNAPEYLERAREKQLGGNNFFHKMDQETYDKLCHRRSEVQTVKMQDIDFKERILKKARLNSKIKPTQPEIILGELITKLGLYFKYSGDGGNWVAGKCPDFINARDKQIIEMNGCYWHDCAECNRDDYIENVFKDDDRILHFAKHGYDTLVVWEHEIKDLVDLEGKILSFAS